MILSLRPFVRGNFLSRFIGSMFSDVLPRRFKRILYIGSAIGFLLRQRKPDLVLMAKLNRVLCLAYNPESILFPAFVHSLVWKDVGKNIIDLSFGRREVGKIDPAALTDEDRLAVSTYIAMSCPEFLRYGSEGLMTADVYKLLTELKIAA